MPQYQQAVRDVMAVLPRDHALSVRAIWRRLDCWALSTVRGALVQLTRDGAAVAVDEPASPGDGCGTRKLYRAA